MTKKNHCETHRAAGQWRCAYLAVATVAVMLLSACSGDGGKWRLQGDIEGANDSTTLVLEASRNGEWVLVDSVRPNGKGHFSVSAEAPAVPNIYRLRCEPGGAAICFPIDSLDHLTLKTSLNGFGADYELAGSDHAVEVMKIDQAAMRIASGQLAGEQLAAWKDSLSRRIAGHPDDIVSYYAINKWIGGQPLYDPMADGDLRIIGAVANAFNSFRPNDPRTQYLVQQLLDGQRRRRSASAPTDTVYANVASLIDIKLQDYQGKQYSLQQVANEHRVVLLDFAMYNTDIAPRVNKLLNDIYKRHGGKGLAIYQVGLDPDNVAWRQAAQNLPWITVYEPMGVDSQTVGAYNVMGVPTTFIIVNGEIVERVEDASKLTSAVSKYL